MDARTYRREIAKLRETHVAVMRALQIKIGLAIAKLEPAEATLAEITNATRLLHNAIGNATTTKKQLENEPDPLAGLRLVNGSTNKEASA